MNIDPAMLRQSAAMMKNMSPEAQKNMFEMAQKMHASGQMPNIPGMTPSFSPTYSAPSPKLQGPPLSSELESIRVLKDCGNVKFKDKLYDEAEKLYNDAILKLEDARLGIDPSQKSNLASLEASILLNLSNIKWANKDYTSLLNISKEVVRINPESGKGYFRYGQALFHLGKAEAALDKLKLAEKYTSSDESRTRANFSFRIQEGGFGQTGENGKRA
jgi:tetratricopeptide (TPR) repeat protein